MFERTAVVTILIAIMLVVGLSMTAGTAQARWEAEWDYEPTSAYSGTTVVFYFNITNIGGDRFAISEATYNVDWYWSSTTETLTGDMDLEPGETSMLTCTFTTPDVPKGRYDGSVRITARASGDWWATDREYNAPFRIIDVPPLSVSIQANKVSGQAPLDVGFSAIVSGGVRPYRYQWDSGDGSTGTDATFAHRYVPVGSYDIIVTVTDAKGSTASDVVTITVDPGNLMVTIQPRSVEGQVPLRINLNSTVSGGTGPFTYSWSTGDGGSGIAPSFWYEYTKPGTYQVKLVVTDGRGNTASDKVTIVVLSSSDVGAGTAKGTSISPVVQGLAAVFVAVSFVGAAVILRRNRP
jgi:PKD repeat protein